MLGGARKEPAEGSGVRNRLPLLFVLLWSLACSVVAAAPPARAAVEPQSWENVIGRFESDLAAIAGAEPETLVSAIA